MFEYMPVQQAADKGKIKACTKAVCSKQDIWRAAPSMAHS